MPFLQLRQLSIKPFLIAQVQITVLFLQGFLLKGNTKKQHIIGEVHRNIIKEMTLSQERSTDVKGPYSDKHKMGYKIMGDSFEGGYFLYFVIMCFRYRNVKMCRAHKICVFEFLVCSIFT